MASQFSIPQGHTLTVPLQYQGPYDTTSSPTFPTGDVLSANVQWGNDAHASIVNGNTVQVVAINTGLPNSVTIADSAGSNSATITFTVVPPPPGTIVPMTNQGTII